MNVKLFVTGSAALLSAWLGVTYVTEVPRESYKRLGKGSQPLSAGNAAPSSKQLPQEDLREAAATEIAAALD